MHKIQKSDLKTHKCSFVIVFCILKIKPTFFPLPVVGVVPPSDRLAQSSTRMAPEIVCTNFRAFVLLNYIQKPNLLTFVIMFVITPTLRIYCRNHRINTHLHYCHFAGNISSVFSRFEIQSMNSTWRVMYGWKCRCDKKLACIPFFMYCGVVK